jgi:hypothetical protein
VRLQVGQAEYSYDHRLYLRRKTVRRLNRQRPVGQRLRFRTKYHLAREMLADLKSRLPKGYQLYVLCDSWYSSRKLLNFCRRQGWHLIGAVKSNRTLDGTKLSQWHKQLKHQRYTRLKHSTATDRKKKRTYFLRQRQGKFNHVSFPVCVFISKRHPGDKRPKYLVSTDCSLSARTVLAYYQKRWAIEVDHLYLKQFLGLADFRVQSFEAVEKWFAIVFLALAYLQWRFTIKLWRAMLLLLLWLRSSAFTVKNTPSNCSASPVTTPLILAKLNRFWPVFRSNLFSFLLTTCS